MTDASAFVRAVTRSRRLPDPRALFLRGFLRHPAMVATVVPSSARLIRRMLAPVDWERTRLFVEYGPGVGGFSLAVLARMRHDARLIALDTNAEFIAYQARRHVRTLLARHFYAVDESLEWWNLPPIRLSWAWKRGRDLGSD